MLKNFGVQAHIRCSSLTRQHGVHINISSDVAKIQHQAIVNKVHAEPDDIEHQGILPHVWSAEQIHEASLGLVGRLLEVFVLV